MKAGKKKEVKIISIFILLLIIFSCKKNDDAIEKETVVKKNEIENKIFSNNLVQFEFDFPDTVCINKSYNGKIKYRGILDTITTDFNLEGDSPKSRYIMFLFTKTKNIDYNIKHLSKIKLDTIGALDNNTILLSDMKFTELGVNYIDGIINDNVFIDLKRKDKNGENLSRAITDEVRATYKIVVIK
jgi:hypothetical protein